MEVLSPAGAGSTDQLRGLYRFMASRKFVASRDELVDAGFGRSKIDNWVRNGRLIKVIRSVYSYGRDVDTPEAVRRAALLAAGNGSALIGRSACEAWGIVKPKPGLPRLIDVGMGSGEARKLKGLSPAVRRTTVKVARRQLDPDDLRQRDGLALARPALALIELAASADDREVMFAFLEACRLELFDERDLKYCFERLYGRRGAKKLRPYLALWVPQLKRIRSVLEGWFLLAWAELRLPMPAVNAKLFGHEVDFYWAEQGVVLELDGNAFHSDPAHRRLDARKQRDLEAHGLIVIRITYQEFAADPAAAVHRIARLLGLR